MIDLFIRTRGIILGHQFLIKKPNASEPIYSQTNLEKPTCVLERSKLNSSDLYLFLYGIPSERKDRQGSPIQYDLVARISSDYTQKEKDYSAELTQLVWIWLNEVKKALIDRDNNIKLIQIPLIEKSQLGQLLDDQKFFPEEYLETLLDATYNQNWTEEQEKELDNKLKEFILELTNSTNSYPSIEKESLGNIWWGGINNDDSCERWIKLVEKILKGETQGKALLLNSAIPKSLEQFSSLKNQEIGVLLARECANSKSQAISSRQVILLNRIKKNLAIFLLLALIISILTNIFSFSFYKEQIQTQNEQIQTQEEQIQTLKEKIAPPIEPDDGTTTNIFSSTDSFSSTDIFSSTDDGKITFKGKDKRLINSEENYICIIALDQNDQRNKFLLTTTGTLPIKKDNQKEIEDNCKKSIKIEPDGTWQFTYKFTKGGERTIEIEKHLVSQKKPNVLRVSLDIPEKE